MLRRRAAMPESGRARGSQAEIDDLIAIASWVTMAPKSGSLTQDLHLEISPDGA